MAERTPPVLINLGETIPGLQDIRLGTFISREECEGLGEFNCPDGGYMVWNDGSDWFVVPVAEVVAEAEVPTTWKAAARG